MGDAEAIKSRSNSKAASQKRITKLGRLPRRLGNGRRGRVDDVGNDRARPSRAPRWAHGRDSPPPLRQAFAMPLNASACRSPCAAAASPGLVSITRQISTPTPANRRRRLWPPSVLRYSPCQEAEPIISYQKSDSCRAFYLPGSPSTEAWIAGLMRRAFSTRFRDLLKTVLPIGI